MLAALALSVAQLSDRRIVSVLARSLALTALLLATLGVALWFAARALARWLGGGAGIGDLAGIAGVLAAVALGWLLFRAIAIAVVGLFADEVVAAVEARHYPGATARPVPLGRSIAMGVGSAARAILFNLAASPLYVLLLVTGVGTAIGFFAVNTLLLGRDLADMVAARHMPATALPGWRRRTRARRWSLGAVATALMLVPGLNLLAPVLSAAMATHMFHRSTSR